MRNKPTVVITHHSASPNTFTHKDVDQWHKQRWPGFVSRLGFHVGYHYVIEANGTIIQTRYHDEEGAHCIGMNRSSIGVCFMGNFNQTRPTTAQVNAWVDLYAKLRTEYPDIPTFPHRKYARTDCHGLLLGDDYFSVEFTRAGLIEQLKQLISYLQSLLANRTMK